MIKSRFSTVTEQGGIDCGIAVTLIVVGIGVGDIDTGVMTGKIATDHVFIAKTAIGQNTPAIVSKIAIAIIAKGIGTSVDAIAA